MMEQNFLSDPSCVEILLRPFVSTQNWWLAAKHEKRRKAEEEAVQLAEVSGEHVPCVCLHAMVAGMSGAAPCALCMFARNGGRYVRGSASLQHHQYDSNARKEEVQLTQMCALSPVINAVLSEEKRCFLPRLLLLTDDLCLALHTALDGDAEAIKVDEVGLGVVSKVPCFSSRLMQHSFD